jgi:hypothetical protein
VSRRSHGRDRHPAHRIEERFAIGHFRLMLHTLSIIVARRR